MKTPSSDFLIRGEEFLERYVDFQLVGREKELEALTAILLRSRAHSVMLIGAGGVGCTALCLGLQQAKEDTHAGFDVVSKRLYWLDSDGLFASGNPSEIHKSFSNAIRTLSRSKESVLIIEDARDFVESSRSHGCSNVINALMREVDLGKFRVILEARDDDLEVVLRSHSDMRQHFTVLDLAEPIAEKLEAIVRSASKRLTSHHCIPISEEAAEMAIELTSKYRVRDLSLSRAQPERSLNLLDRAITSYRQRVHANPPRILALEAELEALKNVEAAEPSAIAQAEKRLLDEKTSWEECLEQLRGIQRNQRDGDELISSLERELESVREKEKEKQEKETDEPSRAGFEKEFSARLDASGFEPKAVSELKERIREAEAAIAENSKRFTSITAEINRGLQLEISDVLLEFSRLSGIPVDRLNQDERKKLLSLEDVLSQRVFGQVQAIDKLSRAVRVARAGLKEPNQPQAAFMFLGPSGVGKTELAKALASILKDDERALLRFDMSEYMEKHAAAKLIGAPPGYEGYEAGGVLTNAMRRNPHSILLFDEIEKAHQDVFNIFLQVLDAGRLTDNRGLTVSFSEAIILMTTNIGQPHFLREDLNFDQAVEETMRELEEAYRPEFLNRFNGRENIVCFNRLELPVIERIARREITTLNSRVSQRNPALRVVMSDEAIAALCADKYNPANGARGIAGYFSAHIYPAVADTILRVPEGSGDITINYNKTAKAVEIESSVND